NHGNRHFRGNALPILPQVQLSEIVGAHQPDKPASRITPLKRAQRVNRIDCAKLALDRRDADRSLPGHLTCREETRRKRRHSSLGLEWIARRNEPPCLVQTQCFHGEERDRGVPPMPRIETAAKQAGALHEAREPKMPTRAVKPAPPRGRGLATCRW